MNPDDYFNAVETRQIGDTFSLRRHYGLDIKAMTVDEATPFDFRSPQEIHREKKKSRQVLKPCPYPGCSTLIRSTSATCVQHRVWGKAQVFEPIGESPCA